ncbi:hypothetical protein ANN_01289 [Periplaneta americana]|uniref:Uncharacterized protein n=1 Tax=Periplaneta americana TaxID=6978 RepID=A0ABQ8TVL6_PERAM|nr:hypothetical protein ANN_01289 [Periplaneta americana]
MAGLCEGGNEPSGSLKAISDVETPFLNFLRYEFLNHASPFIVVSVEDKMFDEIINRFPIRGHSFLPCDMDFGVFKKTIQQCDRVCTCKEYCNIIAHAKRNVSVKIVDIYDVNK